MSSIKIPISENESALIEEYNRSPEFYLSFFKRLLSVRKTGVQ